jgi:hypothetical protein
LFGRLLRGGRSSIWKRQVERIPLDEARAWHLAARLVEHLRGLVEAGDVAVQMACEEAGAARDVERLRGGQRRDRSEQARDFLEPVGYVAAREAPSAEPDVVVLAGTRVVVRLHNS